MIRSFVDLIILPHFLNGCALSGLHSHPNLAVFKDHMNCSSAASCALGMPSRHGSSVKMDVMFVMLRMVNDHQQKPNINGFIHSVTTLGLISDVLRQSVKRGLTHLNSNFAG